MRSTTLTTLTIMLAAALASSTALAGGGHGNGHGRGNDDTPPPGQPAGGTPDVPGNSGNAPGHACEGSASDGGGLSGGPEGQAGASHVAHTNFGPMDADTGAIAATPALGRMMYFWVGSTFDFVLNAHSLPAVQKWVLIVQPEADSGDAVICLGDGTVNAGGQLHIAGSKELDSNLPPGFDPTAEPDPEAQDALLALVPAEDVDCAGGAMLAVHSENYRYSSPRVRFVDSDLLPPPTTGSGGDTGDDD